MLFWRLPLCYFLLWKKVTYQSSLKSYWNPDDNKNAPPYFQPKSRPQMDFQGNFDELGALEDFANDTHHYGSDDEEEDSDDRCSYEEDLDPGHIDAQLSQATQGKPDPQVLAMLVASNRENGDGEEHLEGKWLKVPL